VQCAVFNSLCPLESRQGRLPGQCMNNLIIIIIIVTLSKIFGHCYTMSEFPILPVTYIKTLKTIVNYKFMTLWKKHFIKTKKI